MNGEGIMGLPAGGAPMPAPQVRQMFSPEEASAFEFARSQTSPEEIANETMNAMQQVDPALVLELKQALAGAQLPPQLIEALKMMVDEILRDPMSYLQLRAEILADPDNAEVLGDLLPPTFDAAFFSGLRVALDQIPAAPMGGMPGMMPVQGFAKGGIVELPPMKKLARELQGMGRNGDTILAHINPYEARMLKAMGGSGTINPYTGLPEFFLSKVANAIGGAVKSVGKAVGGVVKGIGNVVKKIADSPIGRMALTVAAVYFMGPAGLNLASGTLGITNAALAMGVNTFAASTMVNLASGMKPGDALKQGLVAGVTAGVGTGLTQGFDAAAPGIPAEPGIPVKPPGEMGVTPLAPGATPAVGTPGTAMDVLAQGNIGEGVPTATDMGFARPAPIELASAPTQVTPAPAPYQMAPSTQATIEGAMRPVDYGLTPGAAAPAPAPAPVSGGISTLGAPPAGAEKSFFDKTVDFFSPAAREQAGVAEAANAANQAKAAYLTSPGATTAGADAVWQKTFESAQPGMLTKYGPLAAAGVGATALLGGFEQPPVEEDPLKEEREAYYESLRAVEPIRPGGGYYGTYDYSPVVATNRPYSFKKGSGPGGVTNFPRRTGEISGPGTETSDDIPAMLSDGEFVFTAKAVRNFGNGSRRKGAARMYKLMKMLEGGAVKKSGIASLKGAKRG